MHTLNLSVTSRLVLRGVVGDKGAWAFWEERFLPRWLPLLLGLVLGPVIASFIVGDELPFAVALALVIPAAILLVRYPFAAVMLWILILPLLRHDSSTAKVVIYWALHRTAIPAALCIAILADWLGLRKRPAVRFGVGELAMVLFLVLGVANVVVLHETESRSLIRFYDSVVIPFCMYWLIRLLAPSERDLRRLALVGIVVVLVQVGVALLSWFAPQVLPSFWQLRAGERTAGTIGSPDQYTVTLVLLAVLLVQTAARSRPGLVRSVMLATVALAFFGVFFSFSRASWLGGVLVLAGLAIIYPRIILGLAAGIPVIIMVLSTGVFDDEVAWAWRRLNTERTAENRIIVYAASLELIRASPVIGWGFGNHDLYAEKLKQRVGDVPFQAGTGITSHNAYLTIAAEFGLIGFLLYMFPALWWATLAVKVRRRLPRGGFEGETWLVMLTLAQLDQVAVNNFNDLFSHGQFTTTLWWMSLGLVATVVWPRLADGRRE